MYRSSPDCILRMHIRLGTRLPPMLGKGVGSAPEALFKLFLRFATIMAAHRLLMGREGHIPQFPPPSAEVYTQIGGTYIHNAEGGTYTQCGCSIRNEGYVPYEWKYIPNAVHIMELKYKYNFGMIPHYRYGFGRPIPEIKVYPTMWACLIAYVLAFNSLEVICAVLISPSPKSEN